MPCWRAYGKEQYYPTPDHKLMAAEIKEGQWLITGGATKNSLSNSGSSDKIRKTGLDCRPNQPGRLALRGIPRRSVSCEQVGA